MTSFSQPKKRTERFFSIDSGEINLNINKDNFNIANNNNFKIENTICSLIDLISDNDLNFFYQDNNTSNFKHNIDQLNLKFYLETEKILSSEGNYNNNNKLFLILFKQINLYIKEIERLNSILINQAKEPNFLKKKMVIISQKKDDFETKELLIQTLKNSLKSLEKKLSKVIQSENLLKEQNEKLKKEIIHYKNLYENSMGISSISVSNSQNLTKKLKSKRTFSDNNKNSNNNNNNNYLINAATINVNKNEYNLYEKSQKKNSSSSKLKIIKAVKSKISYNSKKKMNTNNNNNNNNFNNYNNNNYKILSNSNSGSNIIDENGNNKTQKISINITKTSNKGFHFHSNSNNLPKSNHDISMNMNLNNNNLINRDFEDIENLLIEIKDYFLEKNNNNFIDFHTLINENNNKSNNKVEDKNKKYIIDVKPIIGNDIENNNNNILTPHFCSSNKKTKEIIHFENGNNE